MDIYSYSFIHGFLCHPDNNFHKIKRPTGLFLYMSILLFLVEMTGFEPVSRTTLRKTFFRLRKTVLSDIWKQLPIFPYVVDYLFSLELIIIGSKTATLTWQERHYCGIHTVLCLKTRQLFCYLHLFFFGFWGDPNLPAYLTSLYPVKTKTFPFWAVSPVLNFSFFLSLSLLSPEQKTVCPVVQTDTVLSMGGFEPPSRRTKNTSFRTFYMAWKLGTTFVPS